MKREIKEEGTTFFTRLNQMGNFSHLLVGFQSTQGRVAT